MESVCLRVCFIWFEDLNPVHKQRGVAKAQNVPGEDVEEFWVMVKADSHVCDVTNSVLWRHHVGVNFAGVEVDVAVMLSVGLVVSISEKKSSKKASHERYVSKCYVCFHVL